MWENAPRVPQPGLWPGGRGCCREALSRGRAGCTHFIIGRDMAGCKSSISGEDFYGPYQAQDTAKAHSAELGVQAVPSLNITYTEARGRVLARPPCRGGCAPVGRCRDRRRAPRHAHLLKVCAMGGRGSVQTQRQGQRGWRALPRLMWLGA